MKAAIFRFLVVPFCLVTSLNLDAQRMMPEPNWDRALAVQTIRKTDTQAILKPLFQMALAGRNEELLYSLSAIRQDPGIPNPTRDYLVFSFALGLSDLDANAVSPEVMDFLSTYEALTLVAHDDHPAMAVPLFNIRAATAGVICQSRRPVAGTGSSMDFVVPGGQPGRAPGLRGRARIRFNPTIARTGLGCTGTSR